MVQDQVEGLPWRRVSVNDMQELQQLLVAMARITGADHGVVEHSARREQAGGAVGLVVMRQGAASGGVVCRVASTLARTFRGDRRWALAHAGHPRTDPTGPASLNHVRHSRTVGREVSQR